jgi:arylsulfatase A-like enzyme
VNQGDQSLDTSFSRRAFLRASVVAALGAGVSTGVAAPSAPPNILFIFTDDHSERAISAYGSTINQTPNIDRIAHEGALFRNNFCGNSICAPSRATVLTGKHSHANGHISNKLTFDGSQQTFPKLLRKRGYETALVGKWHLRSDPTGFDHWEVFPGQGSYYNPDMYHAEGKTHYEGYATDIVTDLSLRWLKEQRDQDKPFLLMCQHKAPHRTWAPGPDHLTKYDGETIPEPPTLFDDFEDRAEVLSRNEMMISKHMMLNYDLKVPGTGRKDALGRDFEQNEVVRMTPAQKAAWDKVYGPKNSAFLDANPQGEALVRWKYQRYIKDYLRCIDSVDDNIGRLLVYLDETGLAENTIVVYSSDQGFYLGEHGMYDKRWMYEESLRMPLAIRWPGVARPGTDVKALTQNIDFAPTFLEAAGIEPPGDMQGKSLAPLMQGESPNDWRTAVYYHYYEEGEHNVARHEGVRSKRYKLIHYYDDGQWELFDLKKDPEEMRSLYGAPAHAETQAFMQRELVRLKKAYDVPAST